MKSIITTKKAPPAIGPYSQGVSSGGLVFISGQLPIDPSTGEMPSDIRAQARQSLENIKAIVEEAGASLSDVCKTTCLLSDIKDFAAFNEVYAEFFPSDAPARSAFAVLDLPKGAKVEIEAFVQK